MNLKQHITQNVLDAIQNVYQITPESVEIQFTRKEFEGDYTLVVFPLIRTLKGKPEDIGTKIGENLVENNKITAFNVVKGFLNMSLNMIDFLQDFNQNV